MNRPPPAAPRPTLRRLAWLGTLALAGCASLQQGPAPLPPDPVPARWTSPTPPGAATDLAGWWSRWGDPALPALVAEALDAQTDVATARARLLQARAQRAQVDASARPSVGASLGAQRSATEGRGGSNTWQTGLDASWEADLWGARGAEQRAAQATVAAGELTLAQARISVAAEVALTLLQLRGAQAREALAAQALASQEQTLQTVRWRHEAGLVTELDLAQARTAVEQARAAIPPLQATARQSQHALAVLTGRAPGDLPAALQSPAPLPQPPADLALALPADVLRQRPDVQAAEQRLRAAQARVEQADAARLPSLSLGGSIGLNALSLGALGGVPAVATLLANVQLPVFDGGRVRAQVQAQEGARDEAAAAWRATVLAALQEVEDTLVSIRSGREQLAAQQAAAVSARQAATLAEQRYRSGLVDLPNVLQSQRTALSADDGVTTTRLALATAHVRLVKALGGGWTPTASEPGAR